MGYIDVSVRLELPEKATDKQINSWLLNNFNATSVLMTNDNPLGDVQLEAKSAYDIKFERVKEE